MIYDAQYVGYWDNGDRLQSADSFSRRYLVLFKDPMDMQTFADHLRKEGMSLGRQEGMSLGRKEGMLLGMNEAQHEYARKMLAEGISRTTVKKITGLSDIELDTL